MLLGQGGMLSFGHAIYFGLGGYCSIHVLNGMAEGGLPYFPVGRSQVDLLASQSITRRQQLVSGFGKPISFEFLFEDSVGEYLSRFVYLERFERSALRWEWIFYRGNRGWQLHSVNWSRDVAGLFGARSDVSPKCDILHNFVRTVPILPGE